MICFVWPQLFMPVLRPPKGLGLGRVFGASSSASASGTHAQTALAFLHAELRGRALVEAVESDGWDEDRARNTRVNEV